jgi:membrane protein DedA with SNARE-associated domain
MRFGSMLAALALGAASLSGVEQWLQTAFYPSLLGILVIASLGIPIPEDLPLIAAGVVLATSTGTATWPGTIAVALLGIMTGDLVLYTVGRWWGPGVVNHRSVRWMITPERFERMTRQFRRHGTWLCFFGRFFVGVRAVMCMTAGATHFPYWRFFLADFAGATLSVPLFIGLGYAFAGMIPTLQRYLGGVQLTMLAAALVVTVVMVVVYRRRRRSRRQRAETRAAERPGLAAPGPAAMRAAPRPPTPFVQDPEAGH